MFSSLNKYLIILLVILYCLPVFAVNEVIDLISVTKNSNEDYAPNFSWYENGELVDFYGISKGKVTLLNIWGTWCGPCVQELPDLAQLAKDMPDDGFLFLGLAHEIGVNKRSDVNYMLYQKNITFRNFFSLMSQDTNQGNKLYKALGSPGGLPTTFIIDANHKIINFIVGAHDYLFFRNELLKVTSVSDEIERNFYIKVFDNQIIMDVDLKKFETNSISIALTDVTGKIINEYNVPVKSGTSNQITLNHNLNSGLYFIVANFGNERIIKKIMIVK